MNITGVNDTKLDGEPCVVFTIGHSNVAFGKMLDLLQDSEIKTVVDCRTYPKSRWPQYNAARLSVNLSDNGIGYEARGQNIGGLDGNTRFEESLDELAERAWGGERIVLLCSEGKPEQCHRGTILAPALQARGVKIKHLLYRAQN